MNDNNGEGLTALSTCCGIVLLSKIGTEIIVCSKCNTEYQLVKVRIIEKGKNSSKQMMDKSEIKSEKTYWLGFADGIKWSVQK